MGRERKKRLSVEEELVVSEFMETKTYVKQVYEPKLPKVKGFVAKTDKQAELVTSIEEKEITVGVGSAGVGKSYAALATALSLLDQGYEKVILIKSVTTLPGEEVGFLKGPQPLYSKILTPDGWTTMGEIKIGDYVIGRDGNPTKVINVIDQGEKEVYRVYTTDDSYTDCCEDHIWLTQTFENKKRNKPGSIKSTKQLINTLYTKDGKPNHYLPRNEAVEYSNNTVPIPPYTLGCLLGDGSISDSVLLSNVDQELLDKVNEELKQLNCYLSHQGETINYNIISNIENNKIAKPVKVTNMFDKSIKIYDRVGDAALDLDINSTTLNSRCVNNCIIDGFKYEFLDRPNKTYSNPIKEKLHQLNLLHHKCFDKYIPDIYKYSDIHTRLELLRGLMDTDGTISTSGSASFCTTSLQLAKDVQEIVRSLGGRCLVKSRDRIGKETIRPEDKKTITTRLRSYEFVISLPEHLNPFYITRKASRHRCKYIHRVAIANIEKLNKKEKVKCITVENPEHLYLTDNFIVTHNSLQEKMEPFMMSYMWNIDKILGEGQAKKLLERNIIEILPLAFVRGISIDNSVVLIDETQNLSKHAFKTIITRIGTNSKYIFLGDIEQVDRKKKSESCLEEIVDIFRDDDCIGIVEFSDEDCVRNPIIPKILEKLRERGI